MTEIPILLQGTTFWIPCETFLAKEKRDKVLDDMDNERIVEVQSQASVMFEKLRKSEKIEMLKD